MYVCMYYYHGLNVTCILYMWHIVQYALHLVYISLCQIISHNHTIQNKLVIQFI